jgi:hypothetical protein
VITVDDYSTETGLRVRMACDTTGTAIQIPADEWPSFLEEVKAGRYDELGQKPNIPFIHWPEKGAG